MTGTAVMLAVLPPTRAAAEEPGLSPNWTGTDVRIGAEVTAAALADALRKAAGHRYPLVIDCPDRDTAAVLIGVLARLTIAHGLAVAVVLHTAPSGWQLRAVLPQLSGRRWWPFWTVRTPGGAA